MIKNKKGIQLSFAWIFALIAGAVILFLAIFIAARFLDIGEYKTDTETAKRIDILLNPLQTSFEEGKVTKINLPKETEIYNDCSTSGNFGKQYISLSQESFNKFPRPGEKIGFENKYIFSSNIEQGKIFYIFSKNFEYPFKVSSVIYLTGKNYCFKDMPSRIKNEILGLKSGGSAENFYLENCPLDSIKVCFNINEDCDVIIEDKCKNDCENEFDKGIVRKDRDVMEYSTKTLMYGAIFSDEEIYECQTKRLMKRIENLAEVYYDESQFLSSRDCNTGMEPELLQLQSLSQSFDGNFILLNEIVQEINEKNIGVCKLWE